MTASPLMHHSADKDVSVADLFRRENMSGETEGFSLSRLLSFRNIVIALGIVTFLVFLGSVASPRIAVLCAALGGLAWLVILDMLSRRRWENDLVGQLRRMSADYDRLVREVARSRNELSVLKKSLSDAGALARSQAKATGEAVEQRMARTIADQLSKLGETAAKTPAEEEAIDPAVQELAATGGSNLTDDQVIKIVRAAVREDRIDLFLQPIVNLPQRKERFFETFSRIRIRPGVHLPAERYIAVAMQQELVPVIDNLLLLRALQFIRDQQGGADANRAFFCNVTSLTLNDPKFMGDLVEFIAQNRTLAPRLVFELGQRDLATMSADALPILNGLSQLGCRFSMDQVRSLSFDFMHLEARHIRFVKVDAGLIAKDLKEAGGLNRMKRLKAEFDRNGVDLIVEKIETERQLLEMLDFDIDYGQGYLFGKPAAA